MASTSEASDRSSRSTHDSSTSAPVHFCSTCDKPFASETSRNRHVRYCGSRQRVRPRSCIACNAAKTKCSFGDPCSRCIKKGIACTYNDFGISQRRSSQRPSMRGNVRPTTPSVTGTLQSDDIFLSTETLDFDEEQMMEETQNRGFVDTLPPLEFEASNTLFDEPFTLDDMLGLGNDSLTGYQDLTDVSLGIYEKPTQTSEHWCDWMRREICLSVADENSMQKPNLNALAMLQSKRPYAQRSANIIIQALRSFPTMMQRRETFPWFIHPRSLSSKTLDDDTLPEALSTCMSIAQMFASRTPETKPFIWRTIKAEHCRFIGEINNLTRFELLAAIQACMIYLVMCMLDHSHEDEGYGMGLLVALSDLTTTFKIVCGRGSTLPRSNEKGSDWKDWILAESERRIANLWFIIGCVVHVKAGMICDPAESYRCIPLPGPKSLWEARTQSEWETEFEASRVFLANDLSSLGDLTDLQRAEYTQANARRLDIWNAGIDNLGSLLNLVGDMV